MSFPRVKMPEPRLESPVTYSDVGLDEFLGHNIYSYDSASSHWPGRL